MRVLGILASLVVCVIVAAAGAAICWMAADNITFALVQARVADFNPNLVPWGILVGVPLCLLAIISFFYIVLPRRKKESIVFAGALGEVRIAVDTIENYLSKVALKISDVHKLVPRVKTSGNGSRVTVDAVVHITVGRNIPEITDDIQNNISEQLKNELGIAEVGEIRVHVREVRPPQQTEL